MRVFFRFAIVCLLTLPFAACDSGGSGDDANTVTVSGTLVNVFDRPLQGGTLTFTPQTAARSENGSANRAAPACTATTTANGAYSCDLEPGGYDVTVRVPGYSEDTFPIIVDEDGNATLNLPPLTGDGNIDALLVDAVSGAILTFAHVECSRRLPDGTYTEFEFETTTDNVTGALNIEGVFLGQAQCIVQAGASQIPVILTITENTDGDIPVTQPPPPGAYRVVLRWGASPSDLDAHLTGPDSTNASERFHIYYSDLTYGPSRLDNDDTSSYGPETITFYPNADGVYRYTVHNFTLSGSTEGGQSIYDSPTTVELFSENGLLRTYTAPLPSDANFGLISNSWRVFELTKNGSTITVTGQTGAPADQAQDGLRYVLADDEDDLDVFRPDMSGLPSFKEK